MHSKFALRPHHEWNNGRHLGPLRIGEEKKKERKKERKKDR